VGIKPWLGAVIGGGASSGTAIAVRAMSKSPGMIKHSEGIGLAAGIIASGAMMAMPSTRHAAWTALAAALATSLPRYAESLFLAPSADAGVGEVEIERTGVVRALQGVGIATLEPTGAVMSGGLADGMPRLLGNSPNNQREVTAQLLGVPGLGGPLTAMAGSFGATLFGPR
jgi:hypothetical protein